MKEAFRTVGLFGAITYVAGCGGGAGQGAASHAPTTATRDRGSISEPRLGSTERQGSSAYAVPVPEGVTLVGMSRVNEIRAFPEERAIDGAPARGIDVVAGVAATDGLYHSGLSYEDTVGFYDQALARLGSAAPIRTAMQTATTWSVQMPDGQPARVAVRNTNPPTIEILQVRSP